MRIIGLITLFGAVFLAGCGGSSRPATGLGNVNVAPQVAQIRSYYGNAERFSFDMTLSYQPVEGDSLQFSLIGWAESDGRVRLHASKMGSTFSMASLPPMAMRNLFSSANKQS